MQKALVMENFKHTLAELESRLQALESNDSNPYNVYENAIVDCKHVLATLRNRVEVEDFTDISHEIFFFKTIKPKIVGYLFHFMNLIQIERSRPHAGEKLEKKYFISQITSLQTYFLENLEFYEYYHRGLSNKDTQYFTRSNPHIQIHFDAIIAMTDASFSTTHDLLLAKIIGNIKTIDYLKKKIDSYPFSLPQNRKQNPLLKWTGTKVDLVELIYALHSSGLVNNGQAGLNDMAKSLEQLFNIELGDIYRSFLEIRARKTTPTKLLDVLKTSLINKMIEADA